MDLQTKGRPVREFFEIEARTLYNNYKSIETILPHAERKGSVHPAEEGRFVESLLRSFLNKHLPKDLVALSGFMLKPATKTGEANYERVENEYDRHSGQIDIIIYDQAHFPIYERFEEFAIVPPEGVVGLISVKKTLRIEQIGKEIEAMKNNAALCYHEDATPPYLGIFAFTAGFEPTKSKTTRIKAVYDKSFQEQPFHLMLNELTILDQFTIFKFREDSTDDGEITFVKIDCKDRIHVALQRLIQSILGVYYRKSSNGAIQRPGFISFEKGVHNDAERFAYIKKAEDI